MEEPGAGRSRFELLIPQNWCFSPCPLMQKALWGSPGQLQTGFLNTMFITLLSLMSSHVGSSLALLVTSVT